METSLCLRNISVSSTNRLLRVDPTLFCSSVQSALSVRRRFCSGSRPLLCYSTDLGWADLQRLQKQLSHWRKKKIIVHKDQIENPGISFDLAKNSFLYAKQIKTIAICFKNYFITQNFSFNFSSPSPVAQLATISPILIRFHPMLLLCLCSAVQLRDEARRLRLTIIGLISLCLPCTCAIFLNHLL